MKKLIVFTLCFLLVASFVAAEDIEVDSEELVLETGMNPDSPLYFLDQFFDAFQNPESVANEKAAEAIAMAQAGNEKGLEKAVSAYEKAMAKQERKAQSSEDDSEKVLVQAAKHLDKLAQVRENAPEAAHAGLDNAILRSSQGVEKAYAALEEHNSDKAAGANALAVLEGVLSKAPEAAQKGLENAMAAVARHGAPEGKGKPEEPGSQGKGNSDLDDADESEMEEETEMEDDDSEVEEEESEEVEE
ncbi:hypothetical protein HOC01_04325 [archaeon]|jgi:hypothetical protein|nr:hypothetical protein [archaeon]MBT6698362.1 hypothetical protein [archaeon]